MTIFQFHDFLTLKKCILFFNISKKNVKSYVIINISLSFFINVPKILIFLCEFDTDFFAVIFLKYMTFIFADFNFL